MLFQAYLAEENQADTETLAKKKQVGSKSGRQRRERLRERIKGREN